MELRSEDISPRNRASKRRRISRPFRRSGRGPPARDGSCGRSRSARRRRCRAQSGCGRACRTGLHPMCGTLSRSPAGVTMASSRKRTTRPRIAPRPGGGPSSLDLEEHLQAETDAEERPVARRLQHGVGEAAREQSRHAIRHRALARQHRPLGGAECVPASADTTTSRSGATWRSAFATERRLPMP